MQVLFLECSRKAPRTGSAFAQLSLSASSIGLRHSIITRLRQTRLEARWTQCGGACRAYMHSFHVFAFRNLVSSAYTCVNPRIRSGRPLSVSSAKPSPRWIRAISTLRRVSTRCWMMRPCPCPFRGGHQALKKVADQSTEERKHKLSPPRIRFMWLIA